MALTVAFAVPARAAGVGGAVNSTDRLMVRVVGLRNNKGDVHCTLFASAEDFPTNDDQMGISVTAPIVSQTALCEFRALAPGRYAVVLFHDEDADGKFKRDWLGLPKEGYGFSNDAPARWHAPSFDAASFPFDGGIDEILVHIRY